jgi:FSR family fosmidomycin resistance protein-like MFS transporter
MIRASRAPRLLVALLFVELLDELAGGALGAAVPQIRTDLGLSYGQIGALFAVPAVVGNLIEVPFGLLADRGHRRRLVLGGGVAFTAALVAMAGAPTFAVLLTAFVVYYPASGAFVGLSQAVLVDTDPDRGEALMARWTLAGSVGVVAGPLLFATVVALGGGWRLALGLVAGLFVVGVVAMSRVTIAEATSAEGEAPPGWRDLLAAAGQRSVQKAAVLLQLSDLLGDVLTAFLALYLVDEAGLGPGAAALGLAVWAGAGLVGDALAVPVLDRVDGRMVVRASAVAAGVLYAALLLVDPLPAKLVLLALLGLATAGWYPVLQARFYAVLPGRSGVAVSLGSASGILFGVVPLSLGLVAERFGLGPMMWLLLAGPVVLVAGLRREPSEPGPQASRGSTRSGSSP